MNLSEYDERLRGILTGIVNADKNRCTPPEPGSLLTRLNKAVNTRIPISDQLGVAMRAAYENLLVLRHLDGVLRGSPWTMAPLARSVLVSACRVLFVLLPRDLAQQEENAGRVAKANAFGYRKLVNSMEGTRRLIALVPAADVAEAIRSAPDKIPEKDIKDGPMLEETVNSVVTLLRTAPDSPVTAESAEDLEILGEQIRFMFNTYSGMAHGLAWPLFVPSSARTEPGEEGMPGDWATDFFQLAGLVHLAANALMRASHKAS